MAGSAHRLGPGVCVVWLVVLLVFAFPFRRQQQQPLRTRRHLLDPGEVPAEHIDPAAIDLTPLVNTLINSSQSGSRQLFSLLSVTSHSSLALHKLTLLVYNISGVRGLDSSVFRRRFCYCVTNHTNDLTDFTAILLDVMGNSTSYLHELFKSASILSVSQRNNSDCIYICVMAGHMGREAPELWEVDSITPLFNQTIMEGPHTMDNVSSLRLPLAWHQLSPNVSHAEPSGMSSVFRVHSTAHVTPGFKEEITSTTIAMATPTDGTTRGSTQMADTTQAPPTSSSTATPRTTPWTTSTMRTTTQRTRPSQQPPPQAANATSQPPPSAAAAGCPWRRRRPPADSSAAAAGSATTLSANKLQPCVFELCKFFSRCLCRPTTTSARYCDDSQVWYEQHTSELCRRVRRISFSKSLKQRCLTKMCERL